MELADRVHHLPPYVFETLNREMARRRQAGHDIIDLGISDPDYPPDAAVETVLCEAVHQTASHRYPPYAGTRALREAVAAWYRRRFRVRLDPETEVLITLGSKESLVHLALAVVNPGEVVLAPDPGYPAYAMAGLLFGARTHYVPLTRASHFLPDLEAIPPHIARDSRLLYVNYPNNPTGQVASADAFRAWSDWCRAHGTVLVSDLAYADIVYDGGEAVSALACADPEVPVVESITWSKSYAMQGWRIGALAGSSRLLEAVRRVESNINAGIFLPIQAAAVEALAHDPRDALRRRYGPRRDAAVRALRQLGLQVVPPAGGVYCWVEAPDGDGDAFCRTALDQGVALTPGSAFGPGSRGLFRVSLTHEESQIVDGLNRLHNRVPVR